MTASLRTATRYVDYVVRAVDEPAAVAAIRANLGRPHLALLRALLRLLDLPRKAERWYAEPAGGAGDDLDAGRPANFVVVHRVDYEIPRIGTEALEKAHGGLFALLDRLLLRFGPPANLVEYVDSPCALATAAEAA